MAEKIWNWYDETLERLISSLRIKLPTVESLRTGNDANHPKSSFGEPMAMAQAKPVEKEPVRKVGFEYSGDKIVIPQDMSLEDGIEALQRQLKEESVVVDISEPIAAFPFDGAHALMQVLQRRYGWTNLIPTPGFFGSLPPQMIGVEVALNKRVQIPWGQMTVPKVEGTFSTVFGFENGMPIFKLYGSVKRKDERVLAQIAQEVRDYVKENSIYRGQAIKINFRDGDGNRHEFNPQVAPKFFDTKGLGDCQPIFSKHIEDAIQLNLFNPIQYSDQCRKSGITLKRGVVLGGPYGTGKTLTAHQTAKIATDNGWTFLYLEDVRDLDLAISFARLYQPCVLFAEDVDRAIGGFQRTNEMNQILNTIDGIESKSEQALVMVLTTNNLPNINRAFLRPGRIDAVIEVLPPDADACVRIVRKYVAEGNCTLTGTDTEIKKAIEPLVSANAAFFRTTVDQAKLSAVKHAASNGGQIMIKPEDLATAAKSMVPHAKLINPEHGAKSLLDFDGEQVDPLNMAMEILGAKAVEMMLEHITNPKTLVGIIKKPMNRMMRRNQGDLN